MDKQMIRVLTRAELNQPLILQEVVNDLKTLQDLVQGYIETINIGQDVICLMNEEGRLAGLDTNFYHDQYGWILGDVVFCSYDDKGEFIGLSDLQVKFVKKYIGFPVIKKKVD